MLHRPPLSPGSVAANELPYSDRFLDLAPLRRPRISRPSQDWPTSYLVEFLRNVALDTKSTVYRKSLVTRRVAVALERLCFVLSTTPQPTVYTTQRVRLTADCQV